MPKPKTPTLDRMLAVKDESHAIGQFISWLEEQGCEIASYNPVALGSPAQKLGAALEDEPRRVGRDVLLPTYLNTEQILAKYFEIDLDEAERERGMLLDYIKREQRNERHKATRRRA